MAEHPMAEYWRSPEWIKLKCDLIQERGSMCERCGKETEVLSPHHLTYKNFKKEEPEDLILLCRGCHMKVHGIKIGKNGKAVKGKRKRLAVVPKLPVAPKVGKKKKLSPMKRYRREANILKVALLMAIKSDKNVCPSKEGLFSTRIEKGQLVFTIDTE
jgi:hypothetical protein